MRLSLLSGLMLLAASTVSLSWADVPAPTQEDLKWILPPMPSPANNAMTPERAELGKKLFFEHRLSRLKNMSCATCHSPSLGWSDGLPTTIGDKGKVMKRASPTIINTGYLTIQMWDGRKKDLEDQVGGPLDSPDVMNADYTALFDFLNNTPEYKEGFAKAYPGEKIDKVTLAKAIAAFERTVVSDNSPFDRWLKGDKKALTPSEYRGFQVFKDPARGSCAQCHMAPNFTDDGFHNIGLPQFGTDKADMGRFTKKAVALMKGAVKTPTIRDIARTAPYFHDGSAKTLEAVVDHYVTGGVVKTNLSPNMRPLMLNDQEKADLVAFMKALTSTVEGNAMPNTKTGVPILP